MNLKSQVKSQVEYTQTNKGKAIGSALGIIAGVSYGLAGKKDNWTVIGLTLGGMVGGAILGGLFDNEKNTAEATSNAVGSIARRMESGKAFSNAGGAVASPATRNCFCSPASTAPDFTNVNNLQHCQNLCGGTAGVSYGGNRRTRAVARR
jgi:uncharacterized protein YcfJ